MAFPERLLNDDEEVVLDLHPHWWFLGPAVTLLVIGVLAGLLVLLAGPDGTTGDVLGVGALALVIVALGLFAFRWARWVSTSLVLTTDRLIRRWGVLTKSGIEIPLERINTVFFNQSIFERVIGSGNLAVESASERGTQSFPDIRKPDMVQREIYVQMEDNENRKFDRMRGPAPAPQTAPASVADEIDKLHRLVQQGALTPEEFEAKKARLLAQ